MEISSLISLKNIINSENFERKISTFDLDDYKSDKINCQFFSKSKFKLSNSNQLEFIQSYYSLISGLINIDNRLELSGKEDESLFELDFAKAGKLDNLVEQSDELVGFTKNLALLNSNNNDKDNNINNYNEIFLDCLLNDIQKLKSKAVANAYFKNFEKYQNTISPLGTNLNDLVSLFLTANNNNNNLNNNNNNENEKNAEAEKENKSSKSIKSSFAAQNTDLNASIKSSFTKNKLLQLSDLCEYNSFKQFIADFLLGFQNFNVEELDHIHKQDVFKNPPVVKEELKPKIKAVNVTCNRNISDLVFGFNNGLFGSAAKAKEMTLKALEALGSEFECFSADSEKFNQLVYENEIDLNFNFNCLNDLNKNNKNKNFENNFALENCALIKLKLENGSFIVLNDLEHLRIICTEKSGEINKIFMNLFTLVNSLAKNLKFSYDKKLGFVTANPECIGTGLVMEALIEIKNLIKDEAKFKLFFKENVFRYEVVNRDEGLVKIKNHVTIGYSENDLLGNFVLLINDILEHDK